MGEVGGEVAGQVGRQVGGEVGRQVGRQVGRKVAGKVAGQVAGCRTCRSLGRSWCAANNSCVDATAACALPPGTACPPEFTVMAGFIRPCERSRDTSREATGGSRDAPRGAAAGSSGQLDACCGDGACVPPETASNCPRDCHGTARAKTVAGGGGLTRVNKRVVGTRLFGDLPTMEGEYHPIEGAYDSSVPRAHAREPSSAIIGYYRPSSALISPHNQPSTAIISLHQSSSVLISPHQPASAIIIGHHQSSSAHAREPRYPPPQLASPSLPSPSLPSSSPPPRCPPPPSLPT